MNHEVLIIVFTIAVRELLHCAHANYKNNRKAPPVLSVPQINNQKEMKKVVSILQCIEADLKTAAQDVTLQTQALTLAKTLAQKFIPPFSELALSLIADEAAKLGITSY